MKTSQRGQPKKILVKIIKDKEVKTSGSSGVVYVPSIYRGFKAEVVIYLEG